MKSRSLARDYIRCANNKQHTRYSLAVVLVGHERVVARTVAVIAPVSVETVLTARTLLTLIDVCGKSEQTDTSLK